MVAATNLTAVQWRLYPLIYRNAIELRKQHRRKEMITLFSKGILKYGHGSRKS
jgi:hypothetical protein